MDAYYTKVAWDVPLAQIQPYYNVYALKVPLFYQDSTVGGDENLTHFTLDCSEFHELPEEEYLNKNNTSVRCCKFKK
ncbi:unnamed protein product [marine sediment metagenome]|uniref:Uncharacterized protein n=1 Tax=marine sediment metagenome TaxID=412755 RepID=X0TIL5_9ZZZZ